MLEEHWSVSSRICVLMPCNKCVYLSKKYNFKILLKYNSRSGHIEARHCPRKKLRKYCLVVSTSQNVDPVLYGLQAPRPWPILNTRGPFFIMPERLRALRPLPLFVLFLLHIFQKICPPNIIVVTSPYILETHVLDIHCFRLHMLNKIPVFSHPIVIRVLLEKQLLWWSSFVSY